MWRRIDDVPHGDEARLWLYGVARRTLANHHRGDRRRRRLDERLRRELAGIVAAAQRTPEPTVDVAGISRAFNRLRPADREIGLDEDHHRGAGFMTARPRDVDDRVRGADPIDAERLATAWFQSGVGRGLLVDIVGGSTAHPADDVPRPRRPRRHWCSSAGPPTRAR